MKKVSAITLLVGAAALSAGCVVPGNYSTQVSAGVGIAPDAPDCPYGYYDYAPYDCAAYGYYGPDWFVGGAFIGAGPWFHGPGGFYGHVDNRYDPHHGYVGPKPARGERPFAHFHANEARDGRGHVGNAGHDGGGERNPGAENRR
jgi:hypothetical protein